MRGTIEAMLRAEQLAHKGARVWAAPSVSLRFSLLVLLLVLAFLLVLPFLVLVLAFLLLVLALLVLIFLLLVAAFLVLVLLLLVAAMLLLVVLSGGSIVRLLVVFASGGSAAVGGVHGLVALLVTEVLLTRVRSLLLGVQSVLGGAIHSGGEVVTSTLLGSTSLLATAVRGDLLGAWKVERGSSANKSKLEQRHGYLGQHMQWTKSRDVQVNCGSRARSVVGAPP